MIKKKIVLIGVGELGSRHLQALAKLNKKTHTILVVDPSEDSLSVAESRYKEACDRSSPDVNYLQEIPVLSQVDVAIIASNAKVRLAVIKKLIEKSNNVSNLILEKVLFQSIADLEEAKKLLSENNIKAWVNCPRREFNGYRALKSELDIDSTSELTVLGSNWGLACNSIHFIDIWCFLLGINNFSLSISKNTQIIDSKRNGFIEFIGSITASNGIHKLIMTSDYSSNKDMSISLSFEDKEIIIDEASNIIKVENGCSIDLGAKYQSNMTNVIVDSILGFDDCNLTKFDESAVMHEVFLNEISRFVNDRIGKNFAPIT